MTPPLDVAHGPLRGTDTMVSPERGMSKDQPAGPILSTHSLCLFALRRGGSAIRLHLRVNPGDRQGLL